MNEIVQWCNDNQGFLSAILSIITIIISFWAMVISYKFAKIPYRKKILITPFLEMEDDHYVINVMIVNAGFVTVLINGVNILNNSNLVIGMAGDGIVPVALKPNEVIIKKIVITDDEENIEKNALNLNNKIKVDVYEYGGKRHTVTKGFPVG